MDSQNIYRVHVDYVDSGFYFVLPAKDAPDAERQVRATLIEDGYTVSRLIAKQEPSHQTVGHRFRFPFGGAATYRCTSYDSRSGFWMENETDPKDRRNVSERAPSRTFHRIYEHPPLDEE